MAIVLAYMLFPYYWAIISSTKTRESLYSFSLLPSLDFSNYISLFNNPIFMGAIVNSAIVAFSSSLLSLIISLLAAYALGRLHFPLSRIILICVLMISVFPQVVVLSGMFEVIGWLDFYNRPAALIFSYLLLILPFTTWVLTSSSATCQPNLKRRHSLTGVQE